MNRAARFLVEGRVQGVFYRASTRARALELGLDGHARNLADGRVEVLAAGPSQALDALEAWLWQGPQLAQVSAVQRSDVVAAEVGEGFTTG